LTLLGSEDVGLHAIATCLDQIRLVEIPCALAGGSDEYCDVHQTSLASYGVIGDGGARPFEENSGAPAIGEGACFLVFESLKLARDRNANVLARMLGASYGRRLPGDALGAAVAQAIRGALADSDIDGGVAAAEIDLVVSGAGGGALDRLEIAGLEEVFGDTQSLLLTAPKRYLGEAFGFSSAAQVLVGALALAHGQVPGSGAHAASLLPERWRLPTSTEKFDGDRVLVVSATLEGGATAVVLGRHE
jgi:3-oxoacyl-[acyl-carrier-protein] synthase II